MTFARNGHILSTERPKTSNEPVGGDTLVLPIIEAERIKHQMTRDDFAKSIGVSRRTISNWQNGSTELPLSKLLLIAQMWGCSTDYLLGLDTEQTRA